VERDCSKTKAAVRDRGGRSKYIREVPSADDCAHTADLVAAVSDKVLAAGTSAGATRLDHRDR